MPITGSSSGIGRVTAKYFQERGWNVVATVLSKAGLRRDFLDDLPTRLEPDR